MVCCESLISTLSACCLCVSVVRGIGYQIVRDKCNGNQEQYCGDEERRDLVVEVLADEGDDEEVEENADDGCDEGYLAELVEGMAAVGQAAVGGCSVHVVEIERE